MAKQNPVSASIAIYVAQVDTAISEAVVRIGLVPAGAVLAIDVVSKGLLLAAVEDGPLLPITEIGPILGKGHRS